MFDVFKRILFRWNNRKVISKIDGILHQCDDILEEKGYHNKDEVHKIENHKLYVNIHYYKGKISELLFDDITSTMVLTFNFTTLSSLLDISLNIYCWCCLLLPLQGSRYQQYKKEWKLYVSNEQDSPDA